MRTVRATRYVTPLREGGSLPAIMEADDGGLYVVKFRGAGQGPKALIAELVTGELGRAAGLQVPEIVFVELDAALARNGPDDEILDILRASVGLNLALDYLPGSITFDPIVGPAPEAGVASALVAFDALTMNVDRTPKNPNLLLWHKALYPIDHGASLYFHHAWAQATNTIQSRFPAIRDHVLLPWASELPAAGERMRAALTPEVIDRVLALVPEPWLAADPERTPAEQRAAYASILNGRLAAPAPFLEEAARARSQRV